MEREQFDLLVRHAEDVAQKRPRSYKAQVLGLSLLGYGSLFFAILGLIVLVGLGVLMIAKSGVGRIWGPLLAGAVLTPFWVLAVGIIRTMWVRISPPDGIPLNKNDFPILFRSLDDICRYVKGPRIHAVLLTDELNAAVFQKPRLGVLGWSKNYLIIGLPLMQALSAQQFKAILGHEYGHLSGAHGKFSAWIYQIRTTWYQLMDAFDQEEWWGKAIFQRFFDWYAPFFGAYTFVLARENEYEADRCSADLTSSCLTAEALTILAVKEELLQKEFWPAVHQRAREKPTPTPFLYAEMGQYLRERRLDGEIAEVLAHAMKEETGSTNTHPALKDRLSALGHTPCLPEFLTESAADVLLKGQQEGLAQQLSQEWSGRVQERWSERHENNKISLSRLEELKGRQQQTGFTAEDAYDYAKLSEEFFPEADAVSHYQAVLKLEETHVSAHYALGRLLLGQGSQDGVGHMERAMNLDPKTTLDGCREVYHFFKERNCDDEAEVYKQKFEEHVDFEEQVEAERVQLSIDDTYLSHDFPPERVHVLVNQLNLVKNIVRVYFVRKRTELSTKPLYVLGVEGGWYWYWISDLFSDEDACINLMKELLAEISFSEEIFFMILNQENQKFLEIFSSTPDSLICQRGEGGKLFLPERKAYRQVEPS